ncbi:selenophosphate synthase [Tindallia californiensis]|uniref:Selenide, water dikinase n=1 Tax=Tindallia californiensis TaxID=159292 RepID=A0A1H3NDB4_9FIRM|nr:selenophosphate synthase [Tindallia californiensis]
MIKNLPVQHNPNVLVGLETGDDGAVYKLKNDLAIIQTLDFFTPVVDDPYIFGQVAAANSLSDVYAMGGKPILALNILCFPNCLPTEIMEKILKGGADKVIEAGAVLIGGHSVEDNEPKYGLSVTGTVHPEQILTNKGSKPGDCLILTKPLGSGILNTAIKAEMISSEAYNQVIHVMTLLNESGLKAVENVTVNACTDITGFGLIGHAVEMAEGSEITLMINASKIPYIEETKEKAEMGLIPGGMYRNREFFEKKVKMDTGIEEAIVDIVYDPQTSGGLLLSVPENEVDKVMDRLAHNHSCEYALIGRVVPRSEKPVILER